MRVRDATVEDGAALAAIYNPYIAQSTSSFEETAVTGDLMSGRVSKTQFEGYDWLVCESESGVLGYAYSGRWMARHAYRFTVEVSVYVAEAAQGRGVGRTLYDALFERLRRKDYHSVIGIITLPNPASVALHERYGMEQVAHYREVGRKFDRWIDVGQWQAKL